MRGVERFGIGVFVVAVLLATPRAVSAAQESVVEPTPTRLKVGLGSIVALQALDLVSTTRALRNEAMYEANPIMARVVGNPAAFVAFKAATTAGIVLATRSVARRHPKTAMVLVTAVNGALAVVVANNFSNVGRR